MAFLSVVMNFFTVEMAKGLWEFLIGRFFDFIPSFGWRILVFTVLLKILLLPLDIYQRKTTRDNAKKMERMQPELKKIQEQYPDKTTQSQKQMELYKREKYNMFSACLPMIVTLTVFLTLYAGFTNISSYMSMQTYENLYNTYIEYTINETEDGGYIYDLSELTQKTDALKEADKQDTENGFVAKFVGYIDSFEREVDQIASLSQADKQEIKDGFAAVYSKGQAEAKFLEIFTFTQADLSLITTVDRENAPDDTASKEEVLQFYLQDMDDFLTNYHVEVVIRAKKTIAQHAVAQRYYDYEVQDFLWVSSIWVPDIPWKSPIQDQKSFKSNLNRSGIFGLGSSGKKYLEQYGVMINSYDEVMAELVAQNQGKPNGYLIFIILAAGLSFLSQLVTMRQQKGSQPQMAGSSTMNGTMKIMMIMMPLMMAYFAYSSSTAFTIYIVSNSAISLLLMLLTNYIIKVWEKHKEQKELETVHVLRVPGDDGKKSKRNKSTTIDYSRYGNNNDDKSKKENKKK